MTKMPEFDWKVPAVIKRETMMIVPFSIAKLKSKKIQKMVISWICKISGRITPLPKMAKIEDKIPLVFRKTDHPKTVKLRSHGGPEFS